MKKPISIKTAVVAVVAATALAACGGGGDNTYVAPPVAGGPPPTPPAQSPQAQAGAGFATAFNQNRTNDPTDPIANDIIALDKTAEPIVIPDP